MQTPAQAQDTKFTVDYPIDKVVFKKAGSQSIPHASSSADSVLITIPHGLPFAPLPIGTYSDDNWASSYDLGMGPYFYNTTFNAYGQRVFGNIEADATNIYVTLINYDSTTTFRYRVVALTPPNVPINTLADHVPRADGLLFSSDEQYLKVFMEDTVTIIDSTGAFGDETTTVAHGLGYIPTCLVFTEWGGKIRQIGSENSLGVAGITAGAYLTTNNLVMSYDPFFPGTLKLHYKVYLNA